FFFQAEDGIRDKLVTGVQTCALPISPFLAHQALHARILRSREATIAPRASPPSIGAPLRFEPPIASIGTPVARELAADRALAARSEERRVGKACSVGWAGEECGVREW